MMSVVIFSALWTFLAHFVLQVKVRMFLWADYTSDSVEERFLFWTVSHSIVLFNVLVVDVHPLILWSAFENKIWRFFWICLEVALGECTAVEIFVEVLAVATFGTLWLIIVKMFIVVALNALFSCWEWFFDRTFFVQWIFCLFFNFFLNIGISLRARPVRIL